ncbi:MAG: LysE family transporter [Bacteroidales bacterium]|nr:LysE family transporter [Bacteroidales bacterium]MDD4293348.1 LysE family transporter [Bacteroidales bacterium]MDD4492018.1 LysE family transporter [Bacteroidales bacterium]
MAHPELLIPFISYAIATTFTPGPNNASASSSGMQHGFRKTLPYLIGISIGFFVILAASGLLLDFIMQIYGKISSYLKWIGALYMLWLAVVPFIPQGKSGKKSMSINYTLSNGMILQLVNIKVILYGITLYSSFSALIGYSPVAVIVSSLFLTILGFGSIALWTFIGSAFSAYFKNKIFFYSFNAIMSLLLVYSAVSILLN